MFKKHVVKTMTEEDESGSCVSLKVGGSNLAQRVAKGQSGI